MIKSALAGILGVALLACSGSSPGSSGVDGRPGGGDDDPGGGNDAGGGDDNNDNPTEVSGCDGAALLSRPEAPGVRGPWPVGSRTVQVGRLTAEVWYPAERDSDEGVEPHVYDIREHLPESQQTMIPDDDNTWQECDCYRDLPLDAGHGPYPLIVFMHGTASFRTQSLHHVTHWASRGFVVIAADHPGLELADTLAFLCPDGTSGNRDVSGDAEALIEAASAADEGLAFLDGSVDVDRIGLIGHSAGGQAVAELSSRAGVRVAIPLAAGPSLGAGPDLAHSLYVGGMADSVVRFSDVRSGYQSAPAPKHLVGISNSGHLVVSDLCAVQNQDGQNMLEVAQEHDICGTQLAGNLFDCDESYLAPEKGWTIVEHVTTAVLEDVMHCADRSAAWDGLQERFPDIGELAGE